MTVKDWGRERYRRWKLMGLKQGNYRCDTVTADTCHCSFVKIHRKHNRTSAL